jgi:hypothetical protein
LLYPLRIKVSSDYYATFSGRMKHMGQSECRSMTVLIVELFSSINLFYDSLFSVLKFPVVPENPNPLQLLT